MVLILLLILFCVGFATAPMAAAQSVPEKLVVLTFDDSVRSHFTVVRPILKKYGFGATFFVTEGFDFKSNKRDYMTWQQIAQLHQDGFEIGNHTRDHLSITDDRVDQLTEQLSGIDERCREFGIPKPTSFAWPGNAISDQALDSLRKHGIQFARRGGAPEFPYQQGRGFAYQPGLDHPLLIPSAGDARPDWQLPDFVRAVEQARYGRIAVLQFHGVPDTAHHWVNTPRQNFAAYMNYLAVHGFKVIALRELADYVDPNVIPLNHRQVIEDRQASLQNSRGRDNFRSPRNDDQWQYWLANMLTHRFDRHEMATATGVSADQIDQKLESFSLTHSERPLIAATGLTVLPYPGGRHPRIGFLDGAIRPQRETKFSVFTPWPDGGYVVADIPEAIWWQPSQQPELLYLAHTHVPTVWDRKQIQLEPLEWQRHAAGRLSMERRLPNGVTFGAEVQPTDEVVRMELWIQNGSEQPIRQLRVQNCVMLKAAAGFNRQTEENKIFAPPWAACRSDDGNRWVITAWEGCQRTWANRHCPCLHSDPQFPDCLPGQTRRLRGWLSFYQGPDIQAELQRLSGRLPAAAPE